MKIISLMKILNFFNWHNDKKLTAVIIKPDKHVYGAITDSMKIENIEKLINKLHNDLFSYEKIR